jgi:hypothetical protein
MIKRNNKKWFDYFLFSLALHFIILFFLSKDMGFLETKFIDKNKEIKVYRIEKQFVNIEDDNIENFNKDTRFFSKSNRRVEKQTRAKYWGKPKNRKEIFSRMLEEDIDKGIEDLVQKRKKRKEKKEEFSSTYDFLPDIKPGEETALNTAEFVFYSFYKRVEEAVVPYWNNYVNSYLNEHPNIKKNLNKKDYITEVEAVIKKNGRFHKMIILKSSGVLGLDDAPGLAFSDASPFENPPERLFDNDGFIRMKWRFIVSIVNSYKVGVERLDFKLKDRPDLYHRRQMY